MTPWTRAALAVLTLLTLAGGLPAQADVKYLFSTPTYAFVRNAATPCGGGTCTDLAATESVTGYFTTAAPPPAHLATSDTSPHTITVLVRGDTAVEPDGRFSVFLANASGAILPPGSREGVGTITSDDGGTMPPPGGAHSVPTLSDWAQLALSATLIGAAALRCRLAPHANRLAPRSHA
ncbi:MAG: IPTL-CTERM sorting domain-containing protein [Acidovorax sp.]|nr:IPTL-CTERM sorting domain-containing protein [Acidovorax sp.]